MHAHRTAVPAGCRDQADLPGAGYASAFAVPRPPGDGRSAEQWARAVLEGAPPTLRPLLPAGWRASLGLRLGPRRSPAHVLGWRIVGASADTAVLAARSPALDARNVLRVEGSRVVWVTLVRFDRPVGRLRWVLAAPVHHRSIPYLLARAARVASAAWGRDVRHRAVTAFQRHVANPVTTRLPGQTLLETTGRRSGLPRRTPVGGRRLGGAFWIVSEFGRRSQYVRNIEADPRVRVRVAGRWHTGTAHLLPEDDAHRRLRTLPRTNSVVVRAFGTDLLTVRVDLDGRAGA